MTKKGKAARPLPSIRVTTTDVVSDPGIEDGFLETGTRNRTDRRRPTFFATDYPHVKRPSETPPFDRRAGDNRLQAAAATITSFYSIHSIPKGEPFLCP
jgi:hypothetical protein